MTSRSARSRCRNFDRAMRNVNSCLLHLWQGNAFSVIITGSHQCIILAKQFLYLLVLLFSVRWDSEGYIAIDYICTLFLSMDMQVAKVTAIFSVIVLLAAALIFSSIRQASKQISSNQLHADKTATYKLFVETWSKLIRKQTASVLSISEMLQTLDQHLALYGSPAIIKAHSSLRALAVESGTNDSGVKEQFAKALLDVRKDIGTDSKGLALKELDGLLRGDHRCPEGDVVVQGSR